MSVGGTISNRKGVNVPDVVLPVAALSEKDRVDLEFAAAQSERGEVHADRAVGGARRVNRHSRLECRREQTVGGFSEGRRPSMEIAADFMVELSRAHRPGEHFVLNQLTIKGVGVEQC